MIYYAWTYPRWDEGLVAGICNNGKVSLGTRGDVETQARSEKVREEA